MEAQSEHAHDAYTLLHVWHRFCMLSRRLATKISASELSRKFVRSALLVGMRSERFTLAFHQRGEQGDVGGLPPARRQRQADPVQLVPEELPAVLGLGPANVVVRQTRALEREKKKELLAKPTSHGMQLLFLLFFLLQRF